MPTPRAQLRSRRSPASTFLQADLEAGTWPFAGRQFDAVVVVHYLHRPLLPLLVDALAPGGRLLYETFARGNEQFGRPRNPDFLLRPRELIDAFRALRIVAFEDGVRRCAASGDDPAHRGHQARTTGRRAPVEALAL